jgi:polysaccharide export outer membrane protein
MRCIRSLLWVLVAAGTLGCSGVPHYGHHASNEFGHEIVAGLPRELSMTTLPRYVIEPPDILRIEAIHLVPQGPYRLRPSDIVSISVQGTPPDAPVNGEYIIEPGGRINLSQPYGIVSVAGMTVEEAQQAIDQHLRGVLRDPLVRLSLVQIAGTQQIAGEHLVGPDGTVSLGNYGSVTVVGMTLEEAKSAIEAHLSNYLDTPEVMLDVFAYNSKVYYIVTQGAGLGDRVSRFPITGNETVLDAISYINGMSDVSSKRIWVARPTSDPTQVQILPVDWDGITGQAAVATNYQVLPGDRIFIAEDQRVAFDTGLAKLLAPIERVMGFTILGTATVGQLSGKVLQNANNGFGLGGGF